MGKREGEFAPYYRRRHELSTQLGVLMWGARVVIPPPLRKDVLEELHSTHMGIVKTKALARSYFYFPGIDGAIEKMVKSCPKCVHHIKTPPEVQLQSWNVTETPWERIQREVGAVYSRSSNDAHILSRAHIRRRNVASPCRPNAKHAHKSR